MDRSTVTRSWHEAPLTDAGLRDMPLHGLRHTAAAAWPTTGKPLMYAQRQLGHASITTTEQCYGHLEASFLKSAAAETESAIWGPTAGAVTGDYPGYRRAARLSAVAGGRCRVAARCSVARAVSVGRQPARAALIQRSMSSAMNRSGPSGPPMRTQGIRPCLAAS
jgi:hypothetical protein